MIDALKGYRIIDIAAGGSHSAVVDDKGHVSMVISIFLYLSCSLVVVVMVNLVEVTRLKVLLLTVLFLLWLNIYKQEKL